MKAKFYYSEKYGKEFTIKELSEMSGLPYSNISSRILAGHSADEAAEFAPFIPKEYGKKYYSEKYGKEFTMKELSEMSGLSRDCIKVRIQRGCTVDEATGFVPYEFKHRINQYYSEKYCKEFTVKELSEMCGLSRDCIKVRIQRGWTVDEATGFVPHLSHYKNMDTIRKISIGNILVDKFAYSDNETDYYECINIENKEAFIKSMKELYELYDKEKKI